MNLDTVLPFGMSTETLIILMSALSALSVTASIWYSFLHRDPAQKRAKAIALQRESLRAGITGPRRRQDRAHFDTAGTMKNVVERLNLLKSAQAEKISVKLMRAGWRSREAVVRYLFLKVVLPFGLGALAVIFVVILDLYNLSTPQKVAASIGAVLLGAYLPDIILRNQTQKRQHKIRRALPDALDLMVICAEAGLSLDATLMRVSQEIEDAAPELADELSLTSLELGFLSERKKALQNLATRTDMPVIRGVANTLIQAEKYGTPLAQSLRIMSQESRHERIMKAEEKAARLPAMLTVPMILFILPPLFIVLLGSAILDVIDALSGFTV
jgi:tight adherence protein C